MCGSLIAGFTVLIAVAVSGNVNHGNFTIDEEIAQLFCKNVLDLSDHLLEFYNDHSLVIRGASFSNLVRMCSNPVAPTSYELQDYLTSELDFDEFLAGMNIPQFCDSNESIYIELAKTDPKEWNRISYLTGDIVVSHLICSKGEAMTNEDKAQLFRIGLQTTNLGIWKFKKNSGLKPACYKVKIGKRFASIC